MNHNTKMKARGGRYISETKWSYNADGTVTLFFRNYLTDEWEFRNYKTETAAKAAETKFHNRMSRIYSKMYSE